MDRSSKFKRKGEPWLEAIYWQLSGDVSVRDLAPQTRDFVTQKMASRLKERGVSPGTLWRACIYYIEQPSKKSLFVFKTVLGTTWGAIRIGLEGVPPFTGAAIRFAISAALLLAVARWFRVRFRRKERRIWLWNGLLLFTISYGVVYWAEQWVPSGLAAVLFATFPFFVAIRRSAVPSVTFAVSS